MAAWNPAEWVLQPVKCALRWAFVPSPASVDSVRGGVAADLGTSGVADLGNAVLAPVQALSAGSGCSGISWSFPINGTTVAGSILNACSEPMATVAMVTRTIVGAAVVLGGGFALLRLAGAGFGYNVKVGGGDGD